MPTVTISGLTGFLATHVALEFLENGWNVRGTVRSADKGESVKQLPAFKKHADKISYVIVEDLVKGDFTEAVKGVDAVAHLASPWHFDGKDWQKDYRDPAVKGTKAILEAAAKVDSIKHVVVTSSFAAVGDFSKPATEQVGRVYTEKDWNPATDSYCEGLKADDPSAAATWYCASKTRAEEAAVEVAKNAKFTLATMCPPMIFGPPLQAVKSMDSLDTATASIYSLLDADKIPEAGFPAYADARNVAQAHYQAIARGANGRFLLCNGNYDNQEFADILRAERPEVAKRVPRGEPGKYIYKNPGVFELDASKAEKELGIQWLPVKKTLLDVVDRLVELEKEVKA